MNKTKIIATLGPATTSASQIEALINAGMNVVRINLSHGDRKSHQQCISLVRQVRERLGTFTAILLDTRGPEIRVADLEQPIQLKAGQQLTITSDPATYSEKRIGVNYQGFSNDVSVGNRILLDDGKLALVVEKIENDDVITKTLVTGMLTSRKRVSLPDCIVNLPPLSDKDIHDIIFGVEQEVDFIAMSFVRKAADVLAVREIIEENGGQQAIIAKIENRQGVENIEEILAVADGLMVARGDLGVEMPAEEVPVIQKRIIKASNCMGKPVITATQMLESMITNPTPTRAEASDVTNSIYDGTDAVMLSAETAVGQYPVEAIDFLVRCAEISEASLDYDAILQSGLRDIRKTVTDSISYACCATAADLEAGAIITCTTSGSTARMVARHRPAAPVIAVSPVLESLRKLQVVRGVTPVLCESAKTMDEQLDLSTAAAKNRGLVKNGDLIVITAGMPLGTKGTTNMLKVRTVADICYTGSGICGKMADGKILLIDSATIHSPLSSNTIVVLSYLNPMVLEQLQNAAGLIVESETISPEFLEYLEKRRIATVCNIPDATNLFHNGQTVTIDGVSGHISFGSRAAL